MEKHIDVLNNKVFYEVYNSDKEHCIVLTHGFGVHKNMWKPQIKALAGYKIITIDARGHGKSCGFDKFSITDVCHDIKAILDIEQCNSAVIAGLSMGGYATLEFARLYPEITKGVFIADATPIFIKYPTWEKVSLKYSTPLFHLYTWKNLVKAMARRSSVSKEVRSELEEMFSFFNKQNFIALWAGLTNVLCEQDFMFDCPMTVVYGDKDITGTIKLHAKDWVKHYPHCKVYKIENAGHIANMDNPDEFNKILLDFLEEVHHKSN